MKKRLFLIAILLLVIVIFIAVPTVKAKVAEANISPMLLPPSVAPASFDEARELVGIAEGGYSNDPNDTGNFCNGVLVGTNWGIAAPTYATYFGKCPTAADMKALSYDQATQIYKKMFWDKFALSELPYNIQPLANFILDGSVQHGKFALLLQRAINQTPYSPKINEDNKFGTESKAALKVAALQYTAELYQSLLSIRYEYYQSLPNYNYYSDGWINNRLAKFIGYYNSTLPIA